MSALPWLAAVPLWAWLVVAVLYALAALGWWLAMNESEPDARGALFWAVVWPLTGLIGAVFLIASSGMRARQRAIARRRGWRE